MITDINQLRERIQAGKTVPYSDLADAVLTLLDEIERLRAENAKLSDSLSMRRHAESHELCLGLGCYRYGVMK